MVLFVVSLSKVALPAVANLANDGQLVARRFNTLARHGGWKNLMDRKEYKARLKIVNAFRCASNVGNIQEGSLRNTKANYPVKTVQIQTCGSLYREWRETKKAYKDAPINGLKFNVEYADTQEWSGSGPTVLALHGAPGIHNDFAPIINQLTPLGARIIAPNFPDYSVLDTTKYFRHTFAEKREYLKDFLKAIDINNVDMMITHSSAVYPGMACWIDGHLKVNSFTLINPAGHRTIQGMKPDWFVGNLCRICLNPYGRNFFRKFGRYILAIKGVPVRTESIDNALLSGTTMLLAEVERLSSFLDTLRQQKLPLLYIFSENDKLIEKKIYLEMAEILGAQESNYSRFDDQGRQLTKASPEEWMEILQFKRGGHYAFLKHAKVVNPKIELLLKKALSYKFEKQTQGCKSFDFNPIDYSIVYDCDDGILKEKEETEKLIRNVRLT